MYNIVHAEVSMARRSRSDTTRETLIQAAGKLFAQSGFGAVRARQVAAEAGVALGLIPYHFGSMEKLYREALLRACEAFNDDKQLQKVRDLSDPDEALRSAIALMLRWYTHPKERWAEQLLVREELNPSSAFREIVELRYSPLWKWSCEVVARAVDGIPGDTAVHLGVVTWYAQLDVQSTRRWLIDEFTPELGSAFDEAGFVVTYVDATIRHAISFYRSHGPHGGGGP